MSSAAATKFQYILRTGLEAGSATCHHPELVARQAYNYTELKYFKDWNKITGLTIEGVTNHRWALTKSFLIQEGMSESSRAWYSFLPVEVQRRPLVKHEHYDGDSLLEAFIVAFNIKPIAEHYQQELESMRSEPIPPGMTLVEALMNRALKVASIVGALADAATGLPSMVFIAAVITPFPPNSPLMQALQGQMVRVGGGAPTWPEFFNCVQAVISTNTRFMKEIWKQPFMTHDVAEPQGNLKDDGALELSHKKSVTWGDIRQKSKMLGKRKMFPSKVSSMWSQGDDEQEHIDDEDSDGDQGYEDEDDAQGSDARMRAKVNSLIMENRSLKQRLAQQATPAPPQQQQQASGIADNTALVNAINALVQDRSRENNRSDRSSHSSGGGGGSNSSRSAKRHKVNSAKPAASQGLSRYGRGGEDATAEERYAHNPQGNEAWMRWLRVCNNCARFGAHFGSYCRCDKRPNFDPKADPKLVVPLEPYPRTRAEALERCRQEFRTYGSRVRWNCRDSEAPTPGDLA
jgi:hypothetical protein